MLTAPQPTQSSRMTQPDGPDHGRASTSGPSQKGNAAYNIFRSRLFEGSSPASTGLRFSKIEELPKGRHKTLDGCLTDELCWRVAHHLWTIICLTWLPRTRFACPPSYSSIVLRQIVLCRWCYRQCGLWFSGQMCFVVSKFRHQK